MSPFVIALIPAVVGPLIIWLINRMGIASRIREVEYQLKQLDLIEKLKDLDKKGELEGTQINLQNETSKILSSIEKSLSLEESLSIK